MVKLFSMIRKFRVLMLISSLAMPGWVNAADIRWVPEAGRDGFSVSMPRINITILLDEISRLKGELKTDERQLANEMEQKRVTANDKVLSFLLPGGLLYAAYRKNAYDKVTREHDWIASQLREISTDLVSLAASRGPITVASR